MRFLEIGGNPENTKYLFLGDYYDRGANSIETFVTLLVLKCLYPKNIFLLRGNHETREISEVYGFVDECRQRYTEDLWENFNEVFDYLPLAAIVNDRVFCVHGGLSKELYSVKLIEKYERPLRIPESGLLVDLLWADPLEGIHGFGESERGISYTFGLNIVTRFLKNHGFDLLCRAHQIVPYGFEFPFMPNQSVLTVFSAPNYCEEFENKGAMLMIDENLVCSFSFLDPPLPQTNINELSTESKESKRSLQLF
jgi:serine/threonine-protein phosphatase PP1 catalytic subunit